MDQCKDPEQSLAKVVGLGLGLDQRKDFTDVNVPVVPVGTNEESADSLAGRLPAKISPKLASGSWREFPGFDLRPIVLPNPSTAPQLHFGDWELKPKVPKNSLDKEKLGDLGAADKQVDEQQPLDGYLAEMKRSNDRITRRAFATAWAEAYDLITRNTNAQRRCTLNISRDGVEATKTFNNLATCIVRVRRLSNPSVVAAKQQAGIHTPLLTDTCNALDDMDMSAHGLYSTGTLLAPKLKSKSASRKRNKSSASPARRKSKPAPKGSLKEKRHEIMEGFQAAGVERQVQQLLRIYYEITKFKELFDGNKAASKTDLPDDSDRQFYSKRLKPFLRCYFECCKGSLEEFKKRNLNLPTPDKPRLVYSRKEPTQIIFRLRNWTGNCACRVTGK